MGDWNSNKHKIQNLVKSEFHFVIFVPSILWWQALQATTFNYMDNGVFHPWMLFHPCYEFSWFGEICEFTPDTLDHSCLSCLPFKPLKREQLINIIMFIHGNQFHPNQRKQFVHTQNVVQHCKKRNISMVMICKVNK
jgi:hypothetical protein